MNEPTNERCLVVNSLISHDTKIFKFLQRLQQAPAPEVYVDQSGEIVCGIVDGFDSGILGEKSDRARSSSASRLIYGRKALPDELSSSALMKYPWNLVDLNAERIFQDYESAHFLGNERTNHLQDSEVRGSKICVSEKADVERFVSLDSRKGPIIVDDNVEIQSFSHIAGPCYIGKNSKVRSARIREGTTIGPNCKIAGEVEQSIFSEYSNKSHEGFLGHSIVGSWVNLGALTTNSDLKNTYGNISVSLKGKPFDTGSMKVGVFLGDMSKTSIGTTIASGRKIGVASHVFGWVGEDVASFTMYAKSLGAKSAEVLLESAVQTQRRMMSRRGKTMTAAEERLIRLLFKTTSRERIFQRVAKIRFRLS